MSSGRTPECRRTRGELDDGFVGGRSALTPGATDHLAACAACRDYRERLACIEEPLRGSAAADGLLGPMARDALRSALLGPDSPGVGPGGPWSGRVRWMAGLGASAAAVLLVLAVLRPATPGVAGPEGFARRRGSGDTRELAAAPTGLRALCVGEGPDGPRIRALDPAPGGSQPPVCSVRDRLGLAYRNETGAPRYLALFLRRSDGQWRAVPTGREQSPLGPTEPETPEVPLGEPVALEPAEAGRLEIVAHFAETPVDAGQLLAALQTGRLSPPPFRLVVEIAP